MGTRRANGEVMEASRFLSIAWAEENLPVLEERLSSTRNVVPFPLRKKALEKVVAEGLPSSKLEDWRYTNLSPVSKERFGIPEDIAISPGLRALLNEVEMCSTARMVFLNGRYETSLSRGTTSGIQCEPYSTGKDDSLSEDELGATDALSALNAAFLEDGIVIRITGKVEDPLELVFIHQATDAPAAVHPRIRIIAERLSEATIVENFVGLTGESIFVNAMTDIEVGEGAKLHHIKIQREDLRAIHVARTNITQARDSRYHSHVFHFGGAIVRNEIRPVILGEGCECMLNGLTVIAGEQQVDNATTIDHAIPNSFSREAYKGIYGDEAKGAFSGTIIVRPDAQKTNAIQSNQSLLLSPDATIDTRPQLKIWADDVKCTHGATVGQLDEDALFYIRSRGIPEAEARIMLIRAFASEVVSQLPEDEIREKLDEVLSAKLAAVTAVGSPESSRSPIA